METFDLGACRETRLVLSGTLSTSFSRTHTAQACANPNTLMRLICKKKNQNCFLPPLFFTLCAKQNTLIRLNCTKKESVTLSRAFFLHTHCSVLCKTKYPYQTNVQKTRIPTYLDSASFSLHKQ